MFERERGGGEKERERERRHALPHFRIYVGLLTPEKMYKQEDVRTHSLTH